MSLHRRNPRRDSNEKALLADLRRCGVRCWPISGDGLPDVLTLWGGRYVPLEIKSTRGKNRKDEAHEGVPWQTVSSFAEAALAIGLEVR